MMFLVGLMGLMAVGATALYGLGDSSSDNEDDGMLPLESGGDNASQPSDDLNGLSDLLNADAEAEFEPDTSLTTGTATPGTVTWGDDAEDDLTGTDGADMLNGYGGDDTVSGGADDDELLGDDGNDTLLGEGGDDTLHGGAGYDALFGGDGDDALFGHDEDDALFGEDGDDSLVGGDGNDDLFGGGGNDALHGDLGDDTLDGGTGEDTLFGGWGNDVINGLPEGEEDAAVDYLNGGGGDDLIVAGVQDIVTAGEGADSIALGEWLSGAGHQAQILDFDNSEDSLMVVYDDLAGEEPEVSLVPDDNDPTTQHIVLNGMRIAAVANAADLTLDQIVLIGQTTLDSLTGA